MLHTCTKLPFWFTKRNIYKKIQGRALLYTLKNKPKKTLRKHTDQQTTENEETINTTVSTIKCLLQARNNNKLTKKTDREGRRGK